MPGYRPPKSPPSIHNPWRPAVPPLDPQPAPLHPRYGGHDPDDDTEDEDPRNAMNDPCPFCGEPVDPLSPSTWRRVIGWERKATRTGTRAGGSDIRLREPRDEYAHDLCVSRAKQGIAPTQGSFLTP